MSADGYLSFGARFVIDICGTPEIAFYYDAGDGYTLGKQFGLPYTDDIPIPGVSADIPLLGTIGAQAEITTSGSLADITISLAVGACLGSVCDGQLQRLLAGPQLASRVRWVVHLAPLPASPARAPRRVEAG